MRDIKWTVVIFLLKSILVNTPLFAIVINTNDSIKLNTWIAGFDFSSNTSTFGRFSGVTKQPSFSGYSWFYSKTGLNAGISALSIGNSDSSATEFTYEYDLNLGYDIEIGKYFTISAGFSHFFYSKNSNSLQSIYKSNIQTGLAFSNGKLSANTYLYYLNGDYNEWMNTAQLSWNFEFENVFFKNHILNIVPDINVIFSNQDYFNQYAYKTYWYLYLVMQKSPNITIEELYAAPEKYRSLWRYLNNHPRQLKNFRELDKDLNISDLFQIESKYNLSSLNFNLPIYYSMGNFLMSLSYTLSFPINSPDYLDNSAISYINAGISYTLTY